MLRPGAAESSHSSLTQRPAEDASRQPWTSGQAEQKPDNHGYSVLLFTDENCFLFSPRKSSEDKEQALRHLSQENKSEGHGSRTKAMRLAPTDLGTRAAASPKCQGEPDGGGSAAPQVSDRLCTSDTTTRNRAPFVQKTAQSSLFPEL